MTDKMMTKEQAEKAAIEFAVEKIKKSLVVLRAGSYNVIRLDLDTRPTYFPFIDFVPGDACLVWDFYQNRVIRIFSHPDSSGQPMFVSRVEIIGDCEHGVTYDNYRPIGFNVLEIEKGWGEDGE